MRLLLVIVMVFGLSATAWAGAEFDPAQPFDQASGNRLLRSLLNHAADLIDEHLEISGRLQGSAPSDQGPELRFKFYPEGKSKSDKSISAEAWVDRTADPRQQAWHFRFSIPRSSSRPSPLPENVL